MRRDFQAESFKKNSRSPLFSSCLNFSANKKLFFMKFTLDFYWQVSVNRKWAFHRTAAGNSSTGVSPRPILVGAPRNAVRAFNAGVSLSCLYGRRPQAAALALRRGVVRSAFPLRGKAVMAHPPSGSVQEECVRSCPMLRRHYFAPLSLSRSKQGRFTQSGKGLNASRLLICLKG